MQDILDHKDSIAALSLRSNRFFDGDDIEQNNDNNDKIIKDTYTTDSMMCDNSNQHIYENYTQKMSLLDQNENRNSDSYMSRMYSYGMQKHVYSLFVVVFCSILEGSFISYVKPVHKTLQIQTILYFVRVFSDLIGRPLTLLKLPLFLRSIDGIAYLATLRMALLGIFFAYIYLPEDLRAAYQSDAFILALQFVISITSGFLIVLTYENASQILILKSQSKGIEILTMCFQVACSCACLVSIILLKITNIQEAKE